MYDDARLQVPQRGVPAELRVQRHQHCPDPLLLQAHAHQLAAGWPGRVPPERMREGVSEHADIPAAQVWFEIEEGVLELDFHQLVLVGTGDSKDDGVAV